MVDNRMSININLTDIPDSECLLRSDKAIGHESSTDITDIIYIKTADYNPQDNPQIAAEIDLLNSKLLSQERHCIYVGPGRWGSSDPWLGIPVKWPNISAARLIVEAGLGSYQIDPSQGTHFFQNLTSLGVSYLTINAFKGEGIYDEATLNAMPAMEETAHLRHVRTDKPLTIMVAGMHRQAVVKLNR